ncbi:TPA: polyprenyl synthetase family protein, partial [Candidatus Woesearchaeota archaeon]|nr:polyprenyl synthetase family protein [Candidatus Woesearchaeota archaeon]
MMVGAMVAGANKEVLSLLEKIGNSLGILFQIKDDELGLFADETKLGKPIGSDIKEGKKTLFWYYLMREVSNEEKAKLDGIFGNGLVSEDDIESVRMLLKEKGVMKKVNRKIESLADESRKLISQLDVSEDNKKVLLDLVEYNCTRSY